MRSCSPCCLSSFNCRSPLPPHGSLQETSARGERETSSRRTPGLHGRQELYCWGLVIENELTPYSVPLLRVTYHPTAPAVGAWTQLRGDLWWGHSGQRNLLAINAPASSGLRRSRLRLYWDGRLFSVTTNNVNWNFEKELLERNEISDRWGRVSDEANASWSVNGLKWEPQVTPTGRCEPMNNSHMLRIILLSFSPNVSSTWNKFHF